MLGIKNLKKTYPSGVQALKGLSLDVSPGMFGLLGPNGASTHGVTLARLRGARWPVIIAVLSTLVALIMALLVRTMR